MSFTKFVSVAALAAVAAAQNTTYVVTQTSVETITSCAETVTDCPARNHNGTAYITHTNTITVTSCPPESSVPASAPAPGPEPVASSGPAPGPEPASTGAAGTTSPAKPAPSTGAAATTAAPKPAPSSGAAPAPSSDDETTYVTVEQGVTVTVVGTKSHSTGVAEIPTSNAPVEANGAAGLSLGGAVALVAGALLL